MKNETTSTKVSSKKRIELSPWQNALSGSIAGLISRVVIAPLDVLKIRWVRILNMCPHFLSLKI